MMGENTKIEWADHTMNFWIGCQEVSAACDNCYARVQNAHWGWVNGWGPHGERRRTSASNWHKLRKWNREASAAGVRKRVFSNSLSDFFDNAAHYTWRREAWHYIDQCPNLDFLLLTKRPQNIAKMLPDPETGVKPWGTGWPNVWLGTTVENQEEADRRIPHLLSVPARVHFLSCEPLLGPIDLARIPMPQDEGRRCNALAGHEIAGNVGQCVGWIPPIDWVICGGESGPNARPMHPEWTQSLRDQCQEAGTAFHFKQWGEHGYAFDHIPNRPQDLIWVAIDGRTERDPDAVNRHDDRTDGAGRWSLMSKIGKKGAGRLLDGREWSEFPETPT